MLSIIVAIANNNAIGKDNQLLWHISEDLKRFKRITSGHKIIMGRNTYLSLPKRPLPDRTNIVISDIEGEVFEDTITLNSIEKAIALVKPDEEAFIIGGAMVYQQFLPLADKLYLTIVEKTYDADAFFPVIDYNDWKETECFFSSDNEHGLDYRFVTLERSKDKKK